MSNIFVPQMARLWLATVGTSAPAGPVAAMPSGWRDVGLFPPDSLKWTTNPSFTQVQSHQSDYPTLTFRTADAATVEVDLQEWTGDNFIEVYGGGTITTITGPPDYYKFVPPSVSSGVREIAVCLELTYGSRHYRRIIPRAMQNDGVAEGYDKTKESVLPLRLAVLGSDVGDPWYTFTDDPAFA